MSFESDLYAHLSGHAGLAALVGTRIYPPPRQQQIATGAGLPAVTYYLLGADREQVVTRTIAATLWWLNLDIWAASYLTAIAVSTQLKAALHTFVAMDVQHVTERDPPDDVPDVFRRTIEVEVLYAGSD